MSNAAQRWFSATRSTLYHKNVLAELRGHQALGHRVIIVTGSFEEAIKPIANDLGVDHAICTRLETIDGHYTGVIIGAPTIGEGKAAALQRFLQSSGLSMRGGFAYGDHSSDISMMAMADTPVVVGSDPVLIQYAHKHDWPILTHPRTTGWTSVDDTKFLTDFADILEVAPDMLDDNFQLAGQPKWDSLALLSTIALIDAYRNIVVDPKRLLTLATFGDLRVFVKTLERT
jgi:nitrogenase molybdenum-iron protein alpha/beta subunit